MLDQGYGGFDACGVGGGIRGTILFGAAELCVCRWKGSVRSGQRSFVYTVEGFRSLGAFSSMWPQRRRTCQGRSPPRPRHPRLPANKIGGLAASLASISSLQVGRDTASCLSRPQARVHAGLTWLVNSGSAILMPVPTPLTLNFLCFTGLFLFL